jgi:hypothetical protein
LPSYSCFRPLLLRFLFLSLPLRVSCRSLFTLSLPLLLIQLFSLVISFLQLYKNQKA